jgi:hypothetical protein
MGLYNKVKNKLGKYTWDLALMDFDESIFNRSEHPSRIHIVKNPYKDKWFADPFILDVDNEKVVLLVEEFDKNVQRGRIAKLEIRKVDHSIISCKIVLDLSTHLSFPAIYKVDGGVYVHPENYHSGKSILYKYDSANEKMVAIKSLIDAPIADAVIHQFGNDFYMFATENSDFNGNELCVYKSKAWSGHYDRIGQILFDSNIARMAGDFQQIGNILIRPAQDCNGGYGKKVVFQETTYNSMLTCKTIGELKPCGKYVGLHTFNSYNNALVVIDLKRYCHPILHKIFNLIKR